MNEGNLLLEPTFGVDVEGTRSELTLPGVLAALSDGVPIEFTALRPHQEQAWFSFLVQLAAIALDRTTNGSFDLDEPAWREALRGLTSGADEPWCMVVEELTAPAFMQPPLAEGRLDDLKRTTSFPDDVDILLTGRNHDLKFQRLRAARSEHWAFALVSLQTMEGFSGRDNYGISRMNGGFGNRPYLATASSERWADRWRRDTTIWLENRALLTERYGYSSTGGYALLWLESWNGIDSIHGTQCDPFYVEICRRVRIRTVGRSWLCHLGASKVPRVEADSALGATGDIWTPVDRGDKALTVSAKGFAFDVLQALLFGGDWQPGPALDIRPADGGKPIVIASALVRGQGKTEGLHRRRLPIPPAGQRMLASSEGREQLGTLSKHRVTLAAAMRTKALRPALLQFAQAGADRLNLKDKRMDRWCQTFDKAIDAIFFQRLFRDAEIDANEADRAWSQELLTLARATLEDAMQATPVPSLWRYRALSAAERTLESCARKQLGEYYFLKGEDRHDDRLNGTP